MCPLTPCLLCMTQYKVYLAVSTIKVQHNQNCSFISNFIANIVIQHLFVWLATKGTTHEFRGRKAAKRAFAEKTAADPSMQWGLQGSFLRGSTSPLGHIWYHHKSCPFPSLLGRLVGQQGFERGRWRGQQCNVTPAPDWVNSSARVIATGQGLNFVGLLNCAMMREHTGKTPPIYCISNGGQTANISGLWAANYNYWRQYFFVQTAIFSSSSCVQRCRVNALWFLGSIVHVILQRSYVA